MTPPSSRIKSVIDALRERQVAHPKATKILWTGDLIGTRCNIAIDDSFKNTNEWNIVFFTMATSEYELQGALDIKISSPTLRDDLLEAMKSVYIQDVVARKDPHVTIH